MTKRFKPMTHATTLTATMRTGLLAGVVSLLAGCMVGPDYVRPAAPTSPAFKESEGWKAAQPRDTAPRGDWWEVFGDADLDALERQVDVSNQTVQAAAANVREAQAATQAARAGLFPRRRRERRSARAARAPTARARRPAPVPPA